MWMLIIAILTTDGDLSMMKHRTIFHTEEACAKSAIDFIPTIESLPYVFKATASCVSTGQEV